MSRLELRKFAFWFVLREQNKWCLIRWERFFALVIGTGGGIEVTRLTEVADRMAVAGDFLTIIAAVLGLVLAAFALIVAFLSDSYTMQLQRNPKGV